MLVKIIQWILAIAFSYMLFRIGSLRLWERYCCREPVNGTCMKVHCYTLHGITHTYAEFEYFYNGKKLKHRAIDRLSGRQMKRLIPGESYTIYVNSKNPVEFRCMKSIVKMDDLLMALIGGLMLFGGILMFLQMLVNQFV